MSYGGIEGGVDGGDSKRDRGSSGVGGVSGGGEGGDGGDGGGGNGNGTESQISSFSSAPVPYRITRLSGSDMTQLIDGGAPFEMVKMWHAAQTHHAKSEKSVEPSAGRLVDHGADASVRVTSNPDQIRVGL